MTFVLVLGALGILLVVLVPVAVLQHREATTTMSANEAHANAPATSILRPTTTPSGDSRPLTSTSSRQLTVSGVAIGVWLGLWLFVLSAVLPMVYIVKQLWDH